MSEMNEKALSATIYLALDKWYADHSDKSELPDVYYHEELIGQMTDAAYAVFMAAVKSAKFTEEQRSA